LLVVAALIGIALGLAGGYAIGSAGAGILPEDEGGSVGPVEPTAAAVEVVEVTRQVEVIVTATKAPASVTPALSPTALETGSDTTAYGGNEPDELEVQVTVTPAPLPTTASPTSSDDVPEGEFATFYEVWRLIEAEFDGELPEDQDRIYSAISGSLRSLDDEYTRYVRPELAEKLREDMEGSVSGIGAFVRENADGLVEIVRPIDGQPADLAGLMQGDVIIEVNGESVLHADFDEVLLLVRGPEGTEVVLTVARPEVEEPLTFNLVRRMFEVPVVESELLINGDTTIAYLQLSTFNRNAAAALTEAVETLLQSSPDAIILDLRDNGGGFLDQAVDIADLFLEEGVILYERGSRGIEETFSSETDGHLAEQLPLVVLVNAGSASAAEIVAGAIQDRGRGLLVGETTFGKGSVQQVHTLSDGSELRVTFARWYTPNNLSISEEGIVPDTEVATPADLGGEDDPQLQSAIDILAP
jgi:carboxyl-terminal processing protease